MGGNPQFCTLSAALAFGADFDGAREGRLATVQALSGTGALAVGGAFLARHYKVRARPCLIRAWARGQRRAGPAGKPAADCRWPPQAGRWVARCPCPRPPASEPCRPPFVGASGVALARAAPETPPPLHRRAPASPPGQQGDLPARPYLGQPPRCGERIRTDKNG
jgi:hypothetical protein